MTPYEENRLANIRKNTLLLQELGLDKPFFEPKAKPPPAKKSQPRKRKAPPSDEEQAPPKLSKTSSEQTSSVFVDGGPRRSGRNANKSVDYLKEGTGGLPMPVSIKARESMGALASAGRCADKRVHDPKTFGSIPGIPVGTWWETREACSTDAIHAPWVAGISGSSDGAYSVCLSGGYEDDVDLGYGFTYTGSGGRDLKGTKNAPKNLRTAPQSSDQTFENAFNKALKVSSETGRPVRVLRGYKLKSKYAPDEGYRYDGLYKVSKAWMEPGLNAKGYKVCKFALKRLVGQPPIPTKDLGAGDDHGLPSPAEETRPELATEDQDSSDSEPHDHSESGEE